jgi:Ferredoxin-like domain in Api92-like protein
MPNWVSNWVGVSGTEADIDAFIEKAGKSYPTKTSVWNADTKSWDKQDTTNSEPFSFWNFIKPEDEVAYHGESEKPEGYADWSANEKMAHDLKFSGNGWYDWNVREWGTKWDACDVSVDDPHKDGKGNASVSISFNTAWSIPEPVFQAMVAQHPTLSFDFECEEEQGWGAKFTSSDGDEEGEERSLIMTEEWDIPDSHEDYVSRGREDSCSCAWNEDTDDWYADCPRPEQDFYVVITKTYKVRTNTAQNAWELAQDNDPDEQMELLEDETYLFVKDENGERLYPTLDTDGVEQ